jgi:hypothetical protein
MIHVLRFTVHDLEFGGRGRDLRFSVWRVDSSWRKPSYSWYLVNIKTSTLDHEPQIPNPRSPKVSTFGISGSGFGVQGVGLTIRRREFYAPVSLQG